MAASDNPCAKCKEGVRYKLSTGRTLAYCWECWKERQRAQYANHKNTNRYRNHRYKGLGLTPDVVLSILEKQSGKCAACEGELGESPCLDHHRSKVVGLLCRRCITHVRVLRDEREYRTKLEWYIGSSF